jgi:hypothetical protein
MTTAEERMRILRMVEQGQITAEEADQLLEALENSDEATNQPAARWLRVQITDTRSGRQKVNVNVPAGLLGVGMRLGARFGGMNVGGINIDELLTRVKVGESGKLLDVDGNDGERVQISVE